MTDNFKKYQDIKNSMHQKKQELFQKQEKLLNQIEDLEQAIFIEDMNNNTDEQKELELNLLKTELEKLQGKIKVINDRGYEKQFLEHNRDLKALAEQIETENKANIDTLQLNYDNLAAAFKKLEAERMEIIKNMGEVVRQGEVLQRERNEIKKTLGSNVFSSGVQTDINLLKYTGLIFTDSKEVERAFKG